MNARTLLGLALVALALVLGAVRFITATSTIDGGMVLMVGMLLAGAYILAMRAEETK